MNIPADTKTMSAGASKLLVHHEQIIWFILCGPNCAQITWQAEYQNKWCKIVAHLFELMDV
jgi:hypothetical protein